MIQLDRKQQIVMIVLGAVILFTAGYKISSWQGERYQQPTNSESIVQFTQGEGSREIVVHVSGAVEKPGVYKFNNEARINDALDRAVPLAQGDIQGLNLAAPLKDGQKIMVPLKQQDTQPSLSGGKGSAMGQQTLSKYPSGKAVPTTTAQPSSDRVNINRASSKELEVLPGVGPALSQRIVSYRENNGFFGSEEEIKDVPGIGEKLYERIKENITVNE